MMEENIKSFVDMARILQTVANSLLAIQKLRITLQVSQNTSKKEKKNENRLRYRTVCR